MKPHRSALSLAAAMAGILFFLALSVMLLMPAFDAPGSRRAILDQARAQAEVLGLEAAILRYYVTFDLWPGATTNHVDRLAALLGDNDVRRPFLELRPGALRDGHYLDPWGTAYLIRIAEPGDRSTVPTTAGPHRRVAVWSCGPNRRNEFGDGDDVRSW